MWQSMILRVTRAALSVIAAALLAGCSATQSGRLPATDQANREAPWPEAPAIDPALPGTSLEVPDVGQILALNPAQIDDFLTYLGQPALSATPLHERTSDYLQDLLVGFEYHPDTLNATHTREHLKGNCMSLAILTTALAELAGVKVRYQLIEQMPVFDIRGGLMVTSVHVRTILIQSHHRFDKGKFVFGQSRLAIDFFPEASHRSGRRISREDFLSMYYRNLAVEALMHGQPPEALAYAVEALALAPRQEQAINLVGLIHSRLNDDAGAERFYQYGLGVAAQTLAIMNNYLGLLGRQGRDDEAQLVAAKIRALDEPNPFGWLRLAMTAQQRQQFADAIEYYEKALRYAPELGQAWQGLALSLARSGSGDSQRLIFAQRQAMRFAQDPSRNSGLAKKIYALKTSPDGAQPIH